MTQLKILSRILVTRHVMNGFSGLMNRFIDQSPGGSTNTYITLKIITGTITHTKSSAFPFIDAPPTNSLVSCSRTGLLLLGRTLQYPVSSLLYYPVFVFFSRPKLASRRPDMKHSVQRYFSSFSFFAVVTEMCLSLLCEQSLHSRCNGNFFVRVAHECMSLS
jgi:hypothetical protein